MKGYHNYTLVAALASPFGGGGNKEEQQKLGEWGRSLKKYARSAQKITIIMLKLSIWSNFDTVEIIWGAKKIFFPDAKSMILPVF